MAGASLGMPQDGKTSEIAAWPRAVEYRHPARPATECLNQTNKIARTRRYIAGAVCLHGHDRAVCVRPDDGACVLAPIPAPAQHMGRVGIDHLARLRGLDLALLRHIDEAVAFAG